MTSADAGCHWRVASAKQVHAPHRTALNPLHVLLAGPWQQAEFAAIRADLDPLNQWPSIPSLAAAIAQLTSAPTPPDLLLLAQPRPGVDDQEEIERLRRTAPLTRVIVIAGTWCEGELRTGHPLTGVIRLYWYELPAWWRANLRAFSANKAPSWSEPLTGSRPGQFVRFDAGVNSPQSFDQRAASTLAIDSTDHSVFEALRTGLATYGWTCIWRPRHRPHLNRDLADPPAAAIWDGGQLDAGELESLAQLCTRMVIHRTPVIALLDFPRVEHLSMAKTAGAAAILGKPYQLGLLADELTRLKTPHAAIPKGSKPLAGG
jgi:hypothetical protein